MTIAFVNSSSTADGPPFVSSEPASAAEGNFILAYGTINSVDGVWTLPADIIQIDQFSETAGAPDTRVFIGYKIRGADAGNGYSFGYDGTDASAKVALLAFSGDGLGLDVTYVQGSHYNGYESGTNNLNAAAAAITTNTNNAVVVLAYMTNSSTIDSFGPPSGYTTRLAAGGSANIYGASRAIATAGTETPGVFTHTDAVEDQDQRTFTIAISESSASKVVVLRRMRGY